MPPGAAPVGGLRTPFLRAKPVCPLRKEQAKVEAPELQSHLPPPRSLLRQALVNAVRHTRLLYSNKPPKRQIISVFSKVPVISPSWS